MEFKEETSLKNQKREEMQAGGKQHEATGFNLAFRRNVMGP